jgi:hypothetical protein
MNEEMCSRCGLRPADGGLCDECEREGASENSDPIHNENGHEIDSAEMNGTSEAKEEKAGKSSERRAAGRWFGGLIDARSDLGGELSLFHTPDTIPYAVVEVGDDGRIWPLHGSTHREVWPVRSRMFKLFVFGRYFREFRFPIPKDVLADLLALAEARAVFEGPEEPIFVRVADHAGSVYIDLANRLWEAIEITPTGWRVVADPPVRFRRAPGMLPLPHPEHGRLDDLRPFLNISDDQWPLIVGWLVASARPHGPYPVLDLSGEQGSTKSTTARSLRNILDPNHAGLRAEPRDTRDLAIAANNGWVLAYDNLSRVGPMLSDAICRIATGGAFGTRRLYTDEEEMLFEAQRPVILTGIEQLPERGDLMDRSFIVPLRPIADSARRDERELHAEFEQARAGILGGLVDAVVCALRRQDGIHLEKLPRMADAALWITAAEPTIGLGDGEFVTAFERNRDIANDLVLDSSPVASPLRSLIESEDEWTGTMAELLSELDLRVGEKLSRSREWPKSARGLSSAIARIAPNLRAVGIDVEQLPREGGTGRRLVRIRQMRNASVTTVTSSEVDTVRAETNVTDTVTDHQTAWNETVTGDPAVQAVFRDGGDGGDGGDDVGEGSVVPHHPERDAIEARIRRELDRGVAESTIAVLLNTENVPPPPGSTRWTGYVVRTFMGETGGAA